MIQAEDFLECARGFGYDWYTGVPCSFLTPFINYILDDPQLTYVSSTNEGDAVAVASGATLGGRRAVVMMQNSGLGNAVSPLASLNYVFRIPLLLIVTWRGQPGLPDEPQHELMGRITGALLDALEIPWEYFPTESAQIQSALLRAEAQRLKEQRPYALIMRKDSVASYPLPVQQPDAEQRRPALPAPGSFNRAALQRATRAEVLRRIVALTSEHDTVLIATTGYTGRELCAIADRPNHLYMVGSMGCVAALGLGLAMTRPDLRVIVIDGDGAALMRMGNFATLGAYGGANLIHILLDNEAHDSTGGQATVSAGVSFANIAAACGYASVLAGDDPSLLNAILESTSGAGPRFLHCKIRTETAQNLPRPDLPPSVIRQRLMAHIGRAALLTMP